MRKALERPAEKTAKQVGSESDGNFSSKYLERMQNESILWFPAGGLLCSGSVSFNKPCPSLSNLKMDSLATLRRRKQAETQAWP